MQKPFKLSRRQWLVSSLGILVSAIASPLLAQTKVRRVQPQYIASLALGSATSGTGAETWGLWTVALLPTFAKSGQYCPIRVAL
jgi:hypothetical protein